MISHIADLEKKIDNDIEIQVFGTANLDKDKAEAAIKKVMPKVRHCLKSTPGILLRIKVTKVLDSTRRPPGLSVLVDYVYGADARQVDEAVACAERAAEALRLPKLKKGSGSYVTVSFRALSK